MTLHRGYLYFAALVRIAFMGFPEGADFIHRNSAVLVSIDFLEMFGDMRHGFGFLFGERAVVVLVGFLELLLQLVLFFSSLVRVIGQGKCGNQLERYKQSRFEYGVLL